MKNCAPFFTAVAIVFWMQCFGQTDKVSSNALAGNAQLMSDIISDSGNVIVAYHVEERINMKFGSRITTYDVTDLSLVSTNDLGPDNTRMVTPIYGKAKMRAAVEGLTGMSAGIIGPTGATPKSSLNLGATPLDPKAFSAFNRGKIVRIDIIDTYERILEKGYRSVDMLKRVGNSRFFEGRLEAAAKWYTELYALTQDLEPEFYYRYAQSLKSIQQTEKANQMMAIFNARR